MKPLVGDPSGLVGGGGKAVLIDESVKGGSGRIGEGSLTEATGVGAYTYESSSGARTTRYLFVADKATDQVELFSGDRIDALMPRKTIKGPGAGEDFGFGAAGTAVATDPASGHFFVFDDTHCVVDEFDATGHYLDQIAPAAPADAGPSGLATMPARSAVQRIRLVNVTGGTFTLAYEGSETSPARLQCERR